MHGETTKTAQADACARWVETNIGFLENVIKKINTI